MPNRHTVAPALPPTGARVDLSDEDQTRGRCQMLIVLLPPGALAGVERYLSGLVGPIEKAIESLDLGE
jgi:hypothetical protein